MLTLHFVVKYYVVMSTHHLVGFKYYVVMSTHDVVGFKYYVVMSTHHFVGFKYYVVMSTHHFVGLKYYVVMLTLHFVVKYYVVMSTHHSDVLVCHVVYLFSCSVGLTFYAVMLIYYSAGLVRNVVLFIFIMLLWSCWVKYITKKPVVRIVYWRHSQMTVFHQGLWLVEIRPIRDSFNSMTSYSRIHAGGGDRGQNLEHFQ